MELNIRDLKEDLKKRYPDSVSSLIQAVNTPDSIKEEMVAKDKKINELKKEIEETKNNHETKLRSLRQVKLFL